jgi:catechol 2,3-dioxygenase-like lactoylglutathione lyase family enzyme
MPQTRTSLGLNDANATIPVRNLEAASRFYEDTLGLEPANNQEPGARRYRSGNSTILVYESQYAGTNRATAVTWELREPVDGIVRDLAAKGVHFEHYELPDTRRENDIHISGDLRLAWLKDPDGNILGLASRG